MLNTVGECTVGRACHPYWSMTFATASRVVQLAWDARTTCRGIGEWEISKLNDKKFTLINYLFHAYPHPLPHTHQRLGTSTSLLEEFPKYSDHSLYSTQHKYSNHWPCKQHLLFNKALTHQAAYNMGMIKEPSEQTYVPPVRDVNSSASFSHTQSPTQTSTHTYYYDSPLLNRSAL